MITKTQKINSRHVWMRALTTDRINSLMLYINLHADHGIEATIEWSDLLCLRIETITKILNIQRDWCSITSE